MTVSIRTLRRLCWSALAILLTWALSLFGASFWPVVAVCCIVPLALFCGVCITLLAIIQEYELSDHQS